MTVSINLGDFFFTKTWELQTGSFSGVVRRNEPGEWLVEMHLDEVPPDVLKEVRSVVVRDARRIIFAGYRRAFDDGRGGTTREIGTDGRKASIEGQDCWHWLTSRVVFPNPATWEPWTVAADVRSGTGAAVVKAFVEANAGVSALTERQIAGLAVVSTGGGTVGEWTGRLQPLSDLVARIASEAQVVVEPTLTSDLTPAVYIRDSSDLSASVVLTDIADLAFADSRDAPPRSTWVLAAGSGTGSSRQFRAAGGEAAGVSRIEKVVEMANANSLNELYQFATATHREDLWAVYVSARTNATAAEQYEYLTNYKLGDVVTVQVHGSRYSVPVTAVEITASSEGIVETPVLGTYSPDRLRAIDKRLLGLNEQFDTNIA